MTQAGIPLEPTRANRGIRQGVQTIGPAGKLSQIFLWIYGANSSVRADEPLPLSARDRRRSRESAQNRRNLVASVGTRTPDTSIFHYHALISSPCLTSDPARVRSPYDEQKPLLGRSHLHCSRQFARIDLKCSNSLSLGFSGFPGAHIVHTLHSN